MNARASARFWYLVAVAVVGTVIAAVVLLPITDIYNHCKSKLFATNSATNRKPTETQPVALGVNNPTTRPFVALEQVEAAKDGSVDWFPPPPGANTSTRYGFSFGTGRQSPAGQSDFYLEKSSEGFTFTTRDNADGFIDMGATQLAEVKEAPTYREMMSGTKYRPFGVPVVQGHVYCFTLGGGKYFGKLAVKDVSEEMTESSLEFGVMAHTLKFSFVYDGVAEKKTFGK